MVYDAFPHAILNGKFPFGTARDCFPGKSLKVKDKEINLTAFLEKHKLGGRYKGRIDLFANEPGIVRNHGRTMIKCYWNGISGAVNGIQGPIG